MKRHQLTMMGGPLLAAVLLAGCATGAGSPAATPATEPVVTLFTGYARCGAGPDLPGEQDEGPKPETLSIACEQTASDPRFSGTTTAVGHVAGYEGIITVWGHATVETADGIWECDEFVTWSDYNKVGWREGVCPGRFGSTYGGLTAYFHATTDDGGLTWGFMGWIDEGE